ncbi:MAG: alcohol dehydrogenase catalytic domain-containing protein [Rhizobium pusense]|nr:alcohol dehydrogenase catalytic domain-containing protein [Agrobacterium pusense]
MKAAVLVKPGEFQIKSVPVPELGPNDVLVKVARVGVCGTDVHIFRGHYAADWLPLIPGHEFSGTVSATGSAVTRIRSGQRVTADINIGCGQCFFCRKNEIMSCTEVKQLGIHIDGAFAEYVRVPERLVIPIPDEMSFEVAALAEPLACTVRAAKKSEIRLGESVLIIGAGPIGNFHVQLARTIGAAPIIVADLNVMRLEMAKAGGADIVVSNMDKLDQEVRAVTDGRGADVVIESVGLPALYERAFGLVRAGGRVAAFGLAGDDAVARFSPQQVVLKEIGMKGSVAAMGDDMHEALTLLRFGRIDVGPFLKESRPLAGVQEAIETFASNPGILKMQIEV